MRTILRDVHRPVIHRAEHLGLLPRTAPTCGYQRLLCLDQNFAFPPAAPGYPQETPERVEFHTSQAMGNQLTQIEDIAPLVRFLATDGWWVTGQTIFANGGYTTR